MKKRATFLLVFTLIATSSVGIVLSASLFTPSGQLFEEPSSDHTPGKDNAPLSGNSTGKGLHYLGKDCGICHSPGYPGENYVFSIAGTIFKDKFGRYPLEGAEVILKDGNGKVLSMTTNAAGNFYTYEPIAADSYLVGLGADPNMPRNMRYKAWIRYGDSVRPMVTLAYTGAYEDYKPRMSCNMHHGLNSSRGSASVGNDFHTLPAYPESEISFSQHIMPILKSRCKACHRPGSPTTRHQYYTEDKTVYTIESLDYSGGLDLSGYGKDEDSTYGILDKINLDYPILSDLLIKPSEGGLHGGGAFWNSEHEEYRVIRQWITEGAQDN